MAKRKTAKRAPASRASKPARSKAGKRARRTTTGASRASRKSTGRTRTRGRSTPGRATPAKGSGGREKRAGRGRKVQDLQNVTADVQRRWDLEEEDVPTPPSTLDLDRKASAARSGRAELLQRRREHTAADAAITAGDVDANWEEAYFVGDEAATGDNPTPDQSDVEAVGRAVGVDYEDTEELKSTPKIDKRDKKRWELDPASAEDYRERNKKRGL